MPRLERFGGCSLYMYVGDHPPPHVRASNAEFSVRIAIDNAALLDRAPRKADLREAIDYVRRNRRRLLTRWDELNEVER